MVVGGEREGVCLQPSTGGWTTNTANHANAERTKKWRELLEVKQDEHHADEEGTKGIDSVGSASPSSLDPMFLKRAGERAGTLLLGAGHRSRCLIVF